MSDRFGKFRISKSPRTGKWWISVPPHPAEPWHLARPSRYAYESFERALAKVVAMIESRASEIQ